MSQVSQVTKSMIGYFAGDVRRINHFLKVYAFAKSIGELEGLDVQTQEILELAAVTHDIGIKNSELKYGCADGHHQEIEGPPEAEKLLQALDIDSTIIHSVCELIAHHHSYGTDRAPDLQILIEADFLVNAVEDAMSPESIAAVRQRVFRTKTGISFLDQLFATLDH